MPNRKSITKPPSFLGLYSTKWPALACILCLLGLNFSCGIPPNSTRQVLGQEKSVIKDLSAAEKERIRHNIIEHLKQGVARYILTPGDNLEIMYHIDLVKLNTPYIIGVEDEVSVEFQYHPGLNRTIIVRPDGMVTLPIKGDFEIGGITPEQSAEIIARGFSDIIRDPVVTVRVNKFSSKIFALQKAITNSPRGQAKKILVSPDGYVYLPLLEGIQAAGKTMEELEKEIQLHYDREFKNLEVSLLLESISGTRIFVYGMVHNPGRIQEDNLLTVSQAIGQAGGIHREGSMQGVKVLKISPEGQIITRTVNLKRVIEEGRLEEDLLLPNNSIVFVPRTKTAKAGKFVDDFIRRILTWNGFGFQMNYQVLD